MLNYIKNLAEVKLGQKGALFVEYALILAFVIVVGVVFLTESGNDFIASIQKIFTKTSSEVTEAAAQ